MDTKKTSPPFLTQLKPSKKLQHLCLTAHLLALGAGFSNTLPIVIKLAIAVIIGVNCKMQFKNLKRERRTLKYTETRGWEMSDGGDFETVQILKSTVITTFFIFLQIRNKPAFIIANDAINNDDYRQLIIKLKMTAH